MLLQKKNYFNLRPAVVITAGFIIGIILGYVSTSSINVFSCSLFLLTAFIFIFLFLFCYSKRKTYNATIFIFSLFALFLGLILIKFDLNKGYTLSGQSYFEGYIENIESEYFIDGKYVYSLIVKGDFLDCNNALCSLNLTSDERLFYGTKLTFNANFALLDKPYNCDVFYNSNNVKLLKVGGFNGIIPIIRNRLLLTLQNHAGENYGLTYALLTGDTCYVKDAVLYKYQQIGVAHLFAVSGLHIGLMYGLLFFIVKTFKVDGSFRFLFITFLLFCYVGFCGFSPSSMRAFVIVTIREFAFLSGRKPDGSSNLSLSAFIVLCINPTDLFSVSFLLSFSVYLGLILLSSPFSKYLSNYFPKSISKLISTSVIAELVSTPILLDIFGYSSLFSFLFNMVLIPFISFLYPLIFISSLFLAIFNVSAFAVIPEFTFVIIEFFLGNANVDIFIIKDVVFSFSCVFYYLFLYSFAGKFNFTRKTYNILRIILLITTILAFYIVNAVFYC